MDFRQINYFLGVAEELHFSKAAEKLFIAQPALSRQVQNLEEELGILLFERDKRNVKLTPAGEFLKDEFTRVLGQLANLKRHAQQIHRGEEGELRIGHPGSAIYSVLPKFLLKMRQNYPNVNARLTEITEIELVQAIQDYQIDIGLSREAITDKKFISKVLFAEHFALVVAENHWLTKENFKGMNDVKNEFFILPSIKGKTSKYTDKLASICQKAGFSPKVAYESNYGATILRLVEQNLGISILPISYGFGSPANIRFIELPEKTELYLIWRKDDANPVLKNFVAVCEETNLTGFENL